MIKVLQGQGSKLGNVKTLIADTGYCSEKNVVACTQAKIVPLIAVARQEWASGSSRCVDYEKSPVNGIWFAWPGMSSAWPCSV